MRVSCCHSNGLCTYLDAVFRYTIDCGMRCDVDCACTSRHEDRNQEECTSKQIFPLQTNYNSGCFVAIATACARTWTLISDTPIIMLWHVTLIVRAQAVTEIEIRRSVHPNRDLIYKQLMIQGVLLP